MACGSGCCGPPEDPSKQAETTSTEQDQHQDQNEGTCRQLVQGEATTAECQDACCEGSLTKEADEKTSYTAKASRESLKEADTPSCCEGKTSPCCDVDCLERLALRECNTGDSGTSAFVPACH